MATPHNRAQTGQIAKTVLMPGDPLRAQFVAQNFLEDAHLVTDVRNVYGFTGTYKGTPVTVMASGMGMPSIGIYSYELFSQYDVETIIRIGSAGAYSDKLKLYDIVLAQSAWSESSFARVQNGCRKHTMFPDKQLNKTIMEAGKRLDTNIILAKIHSSDVFYTEKNVDDYKDIYRKHKCECVEMESFALFHNANVLNKKAACLLTISDCFATGEKTSFEERQISFTAMMKVALETALSLE